MYIHSYFNKNPNHVVALQGPQIEHHFNTTVNDFLKALLRLFHICPFRMTDVYLGTLNCNLGIARRKVKFCWFLGRKKILIFNHA